MTRQISLTFKRIVPLILAIMLVASTMFVPTVVSASTETDTNYGLHLAETIDLTDSVSSTVEGITTDGMTVTTTKENVYYNVYGDINTVTFDVYVKSTETTTTVNFPFFHYYDDGDNSVAESVALSLQGGTTLKGNVGDGWPQYSGTVDYSTLLGKWVTVEFKYSSEFLTTRNDDHRKYIEKITIKDGETTLVSWEITDNYSRWLLKYGVDILDNPDAKDSETVKIGFGGSGVESDIKNVKVTYRDNASKVSGYITAIGDVALTDTCKAAIEKAEAAYTLLTDTEKAAVTNYATLTAARASYNELDASKDVAAVIDQIAAIGTVDATDACLAKIVAAEEAYAALTAEKQAKVTNYRALVGARADYNAAKYGIHMAETIDFTDSVSKTDNVDGSNNSTITADTLPIGTTKDESIYYNVYGDINSVSYDIKIDSTATSGIVSTPEFVYYNGSTRNNAIALSFQGGNQLKLQVWSDGVDGGWYPNVIASDISYSNYFNKWITVKLTYSDAASSNTNKKYLKNIVIIDKETSNVLAEHTITSYYSWFSYGADTTSDASDPATVNIGYAYSANSSRVPVTVQNLNVAYRDNASKVIGYIDAIGTVAVTDECLEKIVFAEEAYALLTDTEKAAVTNYATLTAAKNTYNNLVENADVFAVEDKITAIGTVEATDACLAKIVAAEEAYAALTAEKQALVSNYSVLVKARADYDKAYAVAHGIHADETIDFTSYLTDSSNTNFDGANNANITANSLPISTANRNPVYYGVYGDIDTLSYDVYLDSTKTTDTVNFPMIYYYVDDATSSSDGIYLSIQTEGGITKLKHSNNWQVLKTDFVYSDFLQKDLTVKFEYSTSDELYNRSSENSMMGKYIKKITVTDKATNTELVSYEPTSSEWAKYSLKYGVNYYDAATGAADMTKADSETVKIGVATVSNGAAGTVSNLKVTYKNTAVNEKINAINDIVIDNSDSTAAQITDIAETYALLPDDMKSADLTAKIDVAKAAVSVAADAEAPVVTGATIHATDDITKQNMRYSTTMPTAAPEGYSIVEYGTVMFPTQLIGDKELKLGLENGDYKAQPASYVLSEDETAPSFWNAELKGIDFNSGADNACGLRISARSYVKYTNGTTEIIVYSENTEDYNAENPTAGINKGVCNRSVYSVAKNMATAIKDVDTYPTGTHGEIVGEIDLATAGNAAILTFVYNNQARLGAIAAAKAAN